MTNEPTNSTPPAEARSAEATTERIEEIRKIFAAMLFTKCRCEDCEAIRDFCRAFDSERDRVRALEEALKPFAELAELAEQAAADDAPLMLELKEMVEQFVAARSALRKGEW